VIRSGLVEFAGALAIAIIGGLSLATLLTLLAIPAAYVLLHRSAA